MANAKRWGVIHVIWRQGFYPGIGAPSWTRTTATKRPTFRPTFISPPTADTDRARNLLHLIRAQRRQFHQCLDVAVPTAMNEAGSDFSETIECYFLVVLTVELQHLTPSVIFGIRGHPRIECTVQRTPGSPNATRMPTKSKSVAIRIAYPLMFT